MEYINYFRNGMVFEESLEELKGRTSVLHNSLENLITNLTLTSTHAAQKNITFRF